MSGHHPWSQIKHKRDTKPGGVMGGQGNGEKGNALRETVGLRFTLDPSTARTFNTGATRDTEHGKYDYEGFLSPLVLERFAEYMDKHRTQADGTLRSSDNWQKGIPKDAYMKSLTRHFIEVWKEHRLYEDSYDKMEEALCAVVFNAMGYLYEIVKPCR